ncbi:MAG: cbb3-type cytochrome oxidase assembly protein CcoS [Phycisphaeraceae bacterium]
MSVLYVVLPLALVLAGLGVWGFWWAVRQGQYDDLDTPAYRAMFDDEDVAARDDSADR